MVSYTTRDEVKHRLTSTGFRWAADRDGSGAVTEGEMVAIVDPALLYADGIVDAAIAQLVDTDDARALSNAWLKDRATDIATYRAATQGGRRIPKVLRDDYERALEWLEDVRLGDMKVPGLDVLPSEAQRVGRPTAVNVASYGDGCGCVRYRHRIRRPYRRRHY